MKKLLLLSILSLSIGFAFSQQTQKYSAQEVEATRKLKIKSEDVTVRLTSLVGVTNADTATVQDTLVVTVNMWNNHFQTVSITDSLKVLATNPFAGAEVVLRVVADGTIRQLYFPSTWVFVGTKPTTIAANKTGILVLRSFGTTGANIVAYWLVEA